ncbi:MAG: HAMP domain-containing histidine kinase [SAR324 cluster bacterium]|nr:HAMP domain-containing histidine kinase [SAR324 cluster bacterium]
MFLKWIRASWRSTVLRLTLIYAILFNFSLLLVVGSTYLILESGLEQNHLQKIVHKLNKYEKVEYYGGREGLLKMIQYEHEDNQNQSFFVHLLSPAEQTLWVTIPDNWERLDLEQLVEDYRRSNSEWIMIDGSLTYPGESRIDELEITHQKLSNGDQLFVGRSNFEQEVLRVRFVEASQLIFLFASLLGIAGGYIFASKLLSPIKKLVRTVQSAQDGDFRSRVPTNKSSTELNELSILFNTLLDRIERLVEGMQQTLDNVAHDLRTPVSRIRTAIELTLRHPHGEAELKEALLQCAEDSEKLMDHLNVLMDVSEAQTGIMALHPTAISVEQLFREIVSLYEFVAAEKSVNLHFEVAPDLIIRADSQRIRQVLANLVDNAIKYTQPQGSVHLAAHPTSNAVKITVTDDGSGIAADDLPKIFDRLYRGSKSRSGKGLGLGLSLVKAIAHAHQGSIHVRSRLGQGSQFTLSLPKTTL